MKSDTFGILPIENLRALNYAALKERECRVETSLKSERLDQQQNQIDVLLQTNDLKDSISSSLELQLVFSDSATIDLQNQVFKLQERNAKLQRKQDRMKWIIPTAVGVGFVASSMLKMLLL